MGLTCREEGALFLIAGIALLVVTVSYGAYQGHVHNWDGYTISISVATALTIIGFDRAVRGVR